jgi:hypothetical protein
VAFRNSTGFDAMFIAINTIPVMSNPAAIVLFMTSILAIRACSIAGAIHAL